MSSALKYTLAGLTALGIAILGSFLWLDSIVASSTEAVGTELTGTEVTVEDASVSPFSGTGTLSGFRIANLDGYERDYAVEASEISIEVDVTSLWSSPTVVREVVIEAPVLTLAQQGGNNNLRTILRNVNRASDEGAASDEPMIVEHVLVEEGVVNLHAKVGGERSAQVDLPRIELHDLGSGENGRAVGEIVRTVANRVLGAALEAVGGNWMDEAKDAVRDLFN